MASDLPDFGRFGNRNRYGPDDDNRLVAAGFIDLFGWFVMVVGSNLDRTVRSQPS